jgi:hypothetical protein
MMKTSILAGMAVALLFPAICSAKDKAIVQTSYNSKDQAVREISQILEKQGFRIDKTTSSKITAVFDPISNNMGPGMGQGERPNADKGDTARSHRGQRPQGGPGMGQGSRSEMGQRGQGMGPGMGQGGPGMGPGGPGMSENSNNNNKVPTVTVRLKNTSNGVKATFVQKNVSVKEASGNGRMNGNSLSRIVEKIPNNGISYK